MDECCFVFMMFFGNEEEHVNKPFSPLPLWLVSLYQMWKWVVICKSHISSISPLLVQSCGSRSSDLIQVRSTCTYLLFSTVLLALIICLLFLVYVFLVFSKFCFSVQCRLYTLLLSLLILLITFSIWFLICSRYIDTFWIERLIN